LSLKIRALKGGKVGSTPRVPRQTTFVPASHYFFPSNYRLVFFNDITLIKAVATKTTGRSP
jgi:hypothetical protein